MTLIVSNIDNDATGIVMQGPIWASIVSPCSTNNILI